jgi:uncharacterized protein YhhL (DUF1145 family)
MNEKEYSKQLLRIYISISVGILYIIVVFIYAILFHGRFQDLSTPVQIGLVAIMLFGVFYVFFMIKFLSTEKSVKCLNKQYQNRKSLKK